MLRDMVDPMARLDFANGQLAALPRQPWPLSLRVDAILLDRNRLTSLPPDLFAGKYTTTLVDLADNFLTALPVGIFDDLHRVMDLTLDRNRLASLPDGAFEHMARISTLRLNSNSLRTLPSRCFSSSPLTLMKRLYLESNRLTVIPADSAAAIENMASLRVLRLGSNRLTQLDDIDLSGLTRLNELMLHGNNVARGSQPLLESLSANLSQLSITYNPNPLVCNRSNDLRTFACGECALGHVVDTAETVSTGTTVCRQAGFAPATEQRIANLPSKLVVQQRLPQTLQLPPIFRSKRAAFVGYRGDPESLSYALTFGPTQHAIGCGKTVTGSTADPDCGTDFKLGADGHTTFESPERNLNFTVTQSGTFRFNSCDSTMGVALALYDQGFGSQVIDHLRERACVDADVGQIDWRVNDPDVTVTYLNQRRSDEHDWTCSSRTGVGFGQYPTFCGSNYGQSFIRGPLNYDSGFDSNEWCCACDGGIVNSTATVATAPAATRLQISVEENTCPFGASVDWSVELVPGDYTLVVQGRRDDGPNVTGDYSVRMECSDGGDTADWDPGGIVIDASTGTVSGAPEARGHFKAWVHAVDASFQHALIYAWDFDVVQEADFVPLHLNDNCNNTNEGRLGFQTEVDLTSYHPNMEPKIVPGFGQDSCSIEAAFDGTAHATDPNSTRFTLDIPDMSPSVYDETVCFNPRTARTVISPKRMGSYTATLRARNGDESVRISSFSIDVQGTVAPTMSEPTVSPTTSSPTVSPTIGFELDPACARVAAAAAVRATNRPYIEDETVAVAMFDADVDRRCVDRATIFDGHQVSTPELARGLTFSIEVTHQANESWVGLQHYRACVSDVDGRVTVTPTRIGNYTVTLLADNARDGRTAPMRISSWNMSVRPPGTFRQTPHHAQCSGNPIGRHDTTVQSAVGAQQRRFDIRPDVPFILAGFEDIISNSSAWEISGCQAQDLFENYAVNSDAVAQITFATSVHLHDNASTVAPQAAVKVLHSSITGEMSITPGQLGRYYLTLHAESGGHRVELLTVPMHVRQGPDGENCGEHGSPDNTEQDTYSCECTTGWTGATCRDQVSTAAATAAAADSGGTVGAILGTVVFLILGALAALRVKIYRLKHRPIDVGNMQLDVLRALGLGASEDIGPSEFGINLALEQPVGASEVTGDRFRSDLAAAISKAAPKISGLLPMARITAASQSGADDATSKVLVVVSRLGIVTLRLFFWDRTIFVLRAAVACRRADVRAGGRGRRCPEAMSSGHQDQRPGSWAGDLGKRGGPA